MTNYEEKIAQLLEQLESLGYEIEETPSKFSPGYLIFDGNLMVAEVYKSGSYLVSDKADESLLEMVAKPFKKVVDK